MWRFIALAVAVIVLGVVYVDMYLGKLELETRLSKTEKALVDLQIQVKALYDTVHGNSDLTESAHSEYTGESEIISYKQPPKSDPAQELGRILFRRKRAKPRTRNPRKCKNCLPSVEFEGSGAGFQMKTDTTDLKDLWQPAAWLQGASALWPFKFNKISENGRVEIKKSGLYIVYAQMYLIGTPGGVKIEKISMKKFKEVNAKTNEYSGSTVATCKDFTQKESSYDSYTCFTMRVVKLDQDDVIFVRELGEIRGVYYTNDSFFGLIQIGKWNAHN